MVIDCGTSSGRQPGTDVPAAEPDPAATPQHIPNVCYRAMDFLLEVEDTLAEQVYWATADLLDLEVDLLLFDTTSTYWQIEGEDPAPDDDQDSELQPDTPDGEPERTKGFRSRGESKDLPSHCVVSQSGVANSPGCSPSTWIRRPLRLPRRTCTALSSPSSKSSSK